MDDMDFSLPPQLHTGIYDPNRFHSVRGTRAMVKPEMGGFWTSSYNPAYGSDWCRWCTGEDFRRDEYAAIDKFTILEVEDEFRLYVVDSEEDLKELFNKYGGFIAPGIDIHILNFEALAEDFDALHLTFKGQMATRWSTFISMYGWDCESTLFFRPVFKGWYPIKNKPEWWKPYSWEDTE